MPALISCAVIRTELPDLRTEPSSTCATCSVRAISGIATSLPLNENDEVRAVTCSCGIFASRFSSSSEMPSEKYSFALSSLMFTNGSTAMLFSGMAVSDVVGLRETIMKAATIAPSTSSPIATAAQRTWARCFLTACSLLGRFGLPTSSE